MGSEMCIRDRQFPAMLSFERDGVECTRGLMRLVMVVRQRVKEFVKGILELLVGCFNN